MENRMKRFKLHKGDYFDYSISKVEYKKRTQEKIPYVQWNNGKKNGYAICPYCENPIVIVGLYRDIEGNQNIYGKHVPRDVDGIADYDRYSYENCKYSVMGFNVCPKEVRRDLKSTSEYEKIICNTLKTYFDKIIDILSKSIGINISVSDAKIILHDYMYSIGYRHPNHTVDNLPWMLLYFSDFSFSLYNKWISKNSELYNKLSTIDGIKLQDLDPTDAALKKYKRRYIEEHCVVKSTRYIETSVLFKEYKRVKKDDDVKEYMEMTLSHRYYSNDNWIEDLSINVEIDDSLLQNIIQSKTEIEHRNEKLLEVANTIMPDI